MVRVEISLFKAFIQMNRNSYHSTSSNNRKTIFFSNSSKVLNPDISSFFSPSFIKSLLLGLPPYNNLIVYLGVPFLMIIHLIFLSFSLYGSLLFLSVSLHDIRLWGYYLLTNFLIHLFEPSPSAIFFNILHFNPS